MGSECTLCTKIPSIRIGGVVSLGGGVVVLQGVGGGVPSLGGVSSASSSSADTSFHRTRHPCARVGA